MIILKTRVHSRCKDGSLVSEFHFDQDLPLAFIDMLDKRGGLTRRDLSGISLFTYEEPGLFTMKGMAGDCMAYVTHAKEDTDRVTRIIADLVLGL